MLELAVLILLTVLLGTKLQGILNKALIKHRDKYNRLKIEHEDLVRENVNIKAGNQGLEKFTDDIIALYDITKDICKTLDETRVFNIFREGIDRYIKVGDCKFIKADSDLAEYKDYLVLPLIIQNNTIGYLVASGIEENDKDKFHILGQQFLVGIKRAILYQRVQELSITDSLTQVFSRRYFLERFNEEFERSKKFKLKFSFLMIDIDRFKEFNDKYGHLVGDAILREVSKTIKENIRQIDFIGRYGGEELSVVLPETDSKQAHFAAERIRQAVESGHILVYDEDLRVTISIGLSTFPQDTTDAYRIIDMADQALYLAKQTGRNKVCIYGSSQ